VWKIRQDLKCATSLSTGACSDETSALYSFSTRLPPLQDGELVAQDQDLGGLPRRLTPGQPQPRG
jgi:hypothetical protein